MTQEYREEAPQSFTIAQFLQRVASLPLHEIVRRCTSLIRHFTKNILEIPRLIRASRVTGKTPHFVIMTQKLGDIISAETVIDSIKKQNETLIWIIEERYSDVLRWHPEIDHLVEVGSYTEAVLLSKLFFGASLTRLGIDETLCNTFGFKIKNPNAAGVDAANFYCFGSLADAYSLIITGMKAVRRPVMYAMPTFDTQAWIAAAFENPELPLLAAHLVSDEHARSWSAAGAEELHIWLSQRTEFNVVEFGMAPLMAPAATIRHVGSSLPLSAQAAIMKCSSIFVGVDSGFSHMANALAVPSVLLLGKWGKFTDYVPWLVRDGDIILRTQGQTFTLQAPDVIAAIETLRQNSRALHT